MTRWIVIFSLLAAAAGCNNGASNCGATVPASCPTTKPSYQTDVAPLIKTYCTQCHAPGGQEAKKPLDTYSGVSALAADVEGEIGGCDMPPPGEPQPTTAERETILAWLVCGAPNN